MVGSGVTADPVALPCVGTSVGVDEGGVEVINVGVRVTVEADSVGSGTPGPVLEAAVGANDGILLGK